MQESKTEIEKLGEHVEVVLRGLSKSDLGKAMIELQRRMAQARGWMPSQENQREDPVDRTIRDCTPKEFVDWLVAYKGVDPESAENVEINLREQFIWHRLQGRLDRNGTAALIAELLVLRGSVKKLERPAK